MTIEEILAAQKAAQEMTGEEALSALVGEGKKYASMEDLAKGALNGQAHIERLEVEATGYKESATKAKGVDELLAIINKQSATNQGDNHDEHNSDEQNGAFGEAQAADLIAKALGARDAVDADKVTAANQKLVVDELVKLYGNDALKVYKELGEKLSADLNALAGGSPSLVLELIRGGTNASQSTQGLPAGHNQSFQSNNEGVLTKANIMKMYKAGEIDRHTKIKLENENYTLLGRDKFYS